MHGRDDFFGGGRAETGFPTGTRRNGCGIVHLGQYSEVVIYRRIVSGEAAYDQPRWSLERAKRLVLIYQDLKQIHARCCRPAVCIECWNACFRIASFSIRRTVR